MRGLGFRVKGCGVLMVARLAHWLGQHVRAAALGPARGAGFLAGGLRIFPQARRRARVQEGRLSVAVLFRALQRHRVLFP